MNISLALKACTLLLSSLLIACASQDKTSEHDLAANQSCWIEQPVSEDQFGQIGIAIDNYIGGETPTTLSRKRALASLADYLALGHELDKTLETINDETESTQLNDQTIYFIDDRSIDGYLHSYAALSKSRPPEQCSTQTCDISSCQPSWLCTPSTDDQIAMLGLSYQATSEVEQHYKSIENALMQAEYLYGVDIEAHKDLHQSADNYFRYNVLRENSQIDTGAKESLSYAVTDRCYANGTLFSRVALYGAVLQSDSNQSNMKAVTNNDWLNNPKHLGYDGAIGSVEKPVASGLISDQIKLAIRRAAVQLAFEERSDVSDESIIIQYENNNSLLISHISEETKVTLHARVLGIHFKQGFGNSLEVYTWLARIE